MNTKRRDQRPAATTNEPHVYQVTATRDGRWWMIAVDELNELTQARNLAEADEMARELISVVLDKPIESIEVELTVDHVGPVLVASRLADLRGRRARAAELEREASIEASELARALANEGLSIRDIGAVLGVSFQRAHQLVSPSGSRRSA
jgi:CRP-like cAMP-binding protein